MNTSKSKGATEQSATRKRRRTDINNLPENINLTKEILKRNVCRLCATYHESGPKLLPLYESFNGIILSRMVDIFIPVYKNDGLPEVACRKCADQVMAWYKMRINSKRITYILEKEAEKLRLGGVTSNERLLLSETIQNILASYSLDVESVFVCQLCDIRTVKEEFVRHLERKHAAVRDREALEMFILDHVTFEETLASDPDPESETASATAASPGTVDTRSSHSRPQQHAAGKLDGDARGVGGDKREIMEHSCGDRRSCGHETNQKRIPAVCPHCNRVCSNKYNMLVHMNTHAEGQSAKFDCECGKSYSTRGNLVAHRRTAHEKVLPHECDGCGRGFPTRVARDVHARQHSGARPFVCGACGLAFRGAGALRQHARTHAPRALACALCGKRFRRRAHLRYHVATHRHQST